LRNKDRSCPSFFFLLYFVVPMRPINYLHAHQIPSSIDELKYVADRWRMDYNHCRPHSSLGYMAPAAFAAKCFEEGSAALGS
jgi:transposase InsO family protein